MPDIKVNVPARDIAIVVDTLKQIADSGGLRGYENMNRMVATVVYFEGLLNALQTPNTEAESIRKELEKRGELNDG